MQNELHDFTTNSKSGSIFMMSNDKKFLIKSMYDEEVVFSFSTLLRLLSSCLEFLQRGLCNDR